MLNLLSSISYIVFVLLFLARGGYTPDFWSPLQIAFAGVFGLFTLNLGALWISFLLKKKPWIKRAVGMVFLFFTNLFLGYKLGRTVGPDPKMMLENLSIAFTSESMLVISEVYSPFAMALLFAAPLLYPFLDGAVGEKLSRFLPCRRRDNRGGKRVLTAVMAFFLLLAVLTPLPTFNQTDLVLRNTLSYLQDLRIKPQGPVAVERSSIIPGTDQPLAVPFTAHEQPPDIIIVMIESFSGSFLKYRDQAGEPLMPNFTALAGEGFFVENYYGNSIQTSKAQFAALFSQIPSYLHKAFEGYEDNNFLSVAAVLRDRGYKTGFIKAYKDIDFENSGPFLKKNGFDHAVSLYDYLSEDEVSQIWGWGPEDRVLYDHLGSFIDTVRGDAGAPLFLVLHTVMNHMYFDRIPPEKRRLYPDPQNRFENYANSMTLVDEQLPGFKARLQESGWWDNSIIVITGDHGYPIGEHEALHIELSYYEETFTTPLIIIAPGHLEPAVLDTGRYSHLDLGPTLLDMAGFRNVENSFVGTSMIRETPADRPVFCVQPYGGGYLVSIRDNIKYIHHRSENRNFYFDLAADPEEKNPLDASELPEELRGVFQGDIEYMVERQMALVADGL